MHPLSWSMYPLSWSMYPLSWNMYPLFWNMYPLFEGFGRKKIKKNICLEWILLCMSLVHIRPVWHFLVPSHDTFTHSNSANILMVELLSLWLSPAVAQPSSPSRGWGYAYHGHRVVCHESHEILVWNVNRQSLLPKEGRRGVFKDTPRRVWGQLFQFTSGA